MKWKAYSRIFTAFLPKHQFATHRLYKWRLKKSWLRLFSSSKKKKKKINFSHALRSSWRSIQLPLKLFLFIHLLLTFIFLTFFAYVMNSVYKDVKKMREDTQKKYSYWKEVLREHPNFPDAYYQAAWYADLLGDRQNAFIFLDKALLLNPDFKEAKTLHKQLEQEGK